MHKTLTLILEYEQGHLCSVLSLPETNQFPRAQAAPSQRMQSTGNNAKIRHIYDKEYEQPGMIQGFTKV